MFAKIKPTTFINRLQFELSAHPDSQLKAVLRDEDGRIQSTLEKSLPNTQNELTWDGLDSIPYGVYTIELSQGGAEMKMRLVKKA
ncbi:MAG: hypothetical protein QM764_19580 [Chitinophagaceae bacterium]